MDDIEPPRVWLLMGHKLGDNAQVLALAETLGWPYSVKHFVYKKTELLSNRLLGPNLAGIVGYRSSFLGPPWPDLVITAGRRNEPIARWIRKYADKPVRLVHLGRPWADLKHFDLIVATPQYQLPEQANVLHNQLPLHRVTPARLAAAAEQWSPRLAHLPSPRIAVLVGGNSGPYTLHPETAKHLGQAASAMAHSLAGSLLVTTSARTPARAAKALTAALSAPAHVFRWQAKSDENPYYGYLALAERFIVTGDSMSMLTEACVARKPVYIFDLSDASQAALFGEEPWWRQWQRLRWGALIHRLAMRYGPPRMIRDVGAIHRQLVATGRAVWFGQTFPADTPVPPVEDLQRAVERVRGLFEQR